MWDIPVSPVSLNDNDKVVDGETLEKTHDNEKSCKSVV